MSAAARKTLRAACLCALAFGPVACASDDAGAGVDAGLVELDAGALDGQVDAGVDAAMAADAGDAGAQADAALLDAADDAGDSGFEVIRGEDFDLYPWVEPDESGLLVIEVDVPQGARSFSFTVVSPSPRRMQLVDLTGPDGAVIYDALADVPSGPLARALTRNVEDGLPFSLLYPNAPQAPWAAGRYRVRMYLDEPADEGDRSASVDVVFGRPVADGAERALELNVWVASGAALNADMVASDPDIVAGFTELRAIFDAVGIAIGDIAVDDLGAPGDMLSVIDTDAALTTLLAELEGAAGGGVHLVLVDRIEGGEGVTVLGKSTGMPGPPAHPDLPRRGAVLASLESLPAQPERIAELFAHEIGHYLGLRHTSEADGLRHDALEDTPECPAERATFTTTTGQLVLTVEDCDDLGGDNLLFYTPPRTTAEQRTLSEDQVFVLGAYPGVR